jgi:hypothetical protein
VWMELCITPDGVEAKHLINLLLSIENASSYNYKKLVVIRVNIALQPYYIGSVVVLEGACDSRWP